MNPGELHYFRIRNELMRCLYIGIWLLLGILSPIGLAAQYEYVIPRTEFRLSAAKDLPDNHPIITLYASKSGKAILSTGCGFDTILSFTANSMYTVKLPKNMGRLFYAEMKK
jgi:hypothetical protein